MQILSFHFSWNFAQVEFVKNRGILQSLLIGLIFLILSDLSMGQEVTTGSLLDEMIDLQRLTSFPEIPYKTVQFSSFDRRSTLPSSEGWFSNSDGFGREPLPGFEKVLQEPGTNNIGEYLICDIKGPGAIVRMWTANINGNIRLFLDGSEDPVYEGPAEKFIWNTVTAVTGDEKNNHLEKIFRQYDASYFPIPFSRGCRIEWMGELRRLHFYHIQIRKYIEDQKVKTFNKNDLVLYTREIEKITEAFKNPDQEYSYSNQEVLNSTETLPANSVKNLLKIEGEKEIVSLTIKLTSENIDRILRQAVLNIFFDDASVPQIQSPVGDFFGTAAGLDPFTSLPFSVHNDGTMICRFIMPFKSNAQIVIENRSDIEIGVFCSAKIKDTDWDDDLSMHFRAHWRIDHNLTASNQKPQDIPYLVSIGKGRIVGVAAYLMNPSQVPSSSGNWWGEGDEKIFIDDDIVPSTFGTGSEDYFNYSWSVDKLFNYAYCGQPRDDGPANRGFVTNYRYQITDDLLFQENIAFYMELLSHGIVPGFSYGRITYLYSFPDYIDDHTSLTNEDLRYLEMPVWDTIVAYRGSGNATFHEAESLLKSRDNIRMCQGILWTKGSMLKWEPQETGDKISLKIPVVKDGRVRITLTMSNSPESGKVMVYLDDNKNVNNIFDLKSGHSVNSRNHVLDVAELKQRTHDLIIESLTPGKTSVGIDFIWVQYL